MEQKVLSARLRSTFGKSAAKKCRAEGRTPGVMYNNKGKSIAIDVDSNDFLKLFKSITDTTLVNVQLDNNEEYQVFIKDFQHDIVRDIIKHVDLYEVEAGKEIHAKISVKLEGAPVGVRNGGVLSTGTTKVEVVCLPKHLPARIVVNIDDLDTNQSLLVSDLKLADEVKVLTDPNQIIAIVKPLTTAGTLADNTEETESEETETTA